VNVASRYEHALSNDRSRAPFLALGLSIALTQTSAAKSDRAVRGAKKSLSTALGTDHGSPSSSRMRAPWLQGKCRLEKGNKKQRRMLPIWELPPHSPYAPDIDIMPTRHVATNTTLPSQSWPSLCHVSPLSVSMEASGVDSTLCILTSGLALHSLSHSMPQHLHLLPLTVVSRGS